MKTPDNSGVNTPTVDTDRQSSRTVYEPPPGRPRVRGPVMAGVIIISVFFGAFGAWAGLAPLSAAAIAPGAVNVEGNRKTVQHLEGGIIKDLLVRDGDEVKRGQLLMRLDSTQAQARREAELSNCIALLAEEARLLAERDGAERIAFPPQATTTAPARRSACHREHRCPNPRVREPAQESHWTHRYIAAEDRAASFPDRWAGRAGAGGRRADCPAERGARRR